MAVQFFTSANTIDTASLPGPFASVSGALTVGIGDGPSGINTIRATTSSDRAFLANISVANTSGIILGFGLIPLLPLAGATPSVVAVIDQSGINGLLEIFPNGAIEFAVGGQHIVSPAGSVLPGQRNYIELFIETLNSSTAPVEIFVGGIVVATGDIDVSAATNPLTSVWVGQSGTNTILVFDSIYCSDTVGGVNDTPLGPGVQVGVMQPIDEGQFQQWNFFGAPTDWESADNLPPTGDAAYIFDSANGHQDAVKLTLPQSLPSVFAVSVVASARGTDVDGVIQTGVGDGTSVTYGSNIDLGTSYEFSSTIFNSNPNDVQPWIYAALTQLQAAVKVAESVDTGGNMNIQGNFGTEIAAGTTFEVINCGHFNSESGTSVNTSVSGSAVTVDAGTINMGSGSSIDAGGSGVTGTVTVSGTLTLDSNSSLDVGDTSSGFSGAGTLTIDTGATLIIGNAASINLAGTIEITSPTSITYIGLAGVNTHNGSMLTNFTFASTGFVVAFTDTSYSDGSGGSIASWAWDFGDSGTSTAQNPSHTYASGGTYAVKLTTTDASSNTSNCTLSVTV